MVDEHSIPDGAKKRATSSDVARLSGVSQSVVSFYLTGARPVSDDARRRIRAAIEELGFRPNRMARSLRTTRSGQVAIAVPFISNPIYGSFAAAAQRHLSDSGYLTLMISQLDAPEQSNEYFEMIADSHVDGLLIFPFPNHVDGIRTLANDGVRVVMADRAIDVGEGAAVDSVLVDNAWGVKEAAAHLIARGHHSIGLLTTVDPTYGDPRVRGFKEAHADAGTIVDPDLLVRGDGSMRSGFQLTQRLCVDHPQMTALITTANMQTLGSLEALRSVPHAERIAFIGHDSDDSQLHLPDNIATIRYPAAALGEACAAMLLDRLGPGSQSAARSETLYPRLHFSPTDLAPGLDRNSSGPGVA